MLKVGINENVKLVGANINDKGTLNISFKQAGDVADTTPVDDLLNQTIGDKPSDGTSGMLLFAPNVEFNGETRKLVDIARDLGGLRDQLQHLLQGYVTSDQAVLDPYAGIDTSDPAAFQASLTNQTTIERIYKNLATQFVTKVQGLGDALNQEFRLLLVRRSKASHYGTFRNRYINNNPFWESMKIPAAQSKLAFNAYEIKNGKNIGTPVAKDATTDTPAAGNSAADAVSDILGTR